MQIKRLTDGSETWNAANGMCTSAEIKYIVLSPGTKKAAIEAVLDGAPKSFGGLALKEVRFDGYTGTDIMIDAVYGGTAEPDAEDVEDAPVMSFSCGGGTRHVTHSISQRIAVGTKSAGGAVGWNGKSDDSCAIEGVDIPAAQLKMSLTKKMRASRFTTDYLRIIASLTGKVNSKPFKGWKAGEVMFGGITYQYQTNAKMIDVTYDFSIQMNESRVVIAGNTISKNGFQYVWAISKNVVTENVPATEVEAIYVDTVCESADFSPLGL